MTTIAETSGTIRDVIDAVATAALNLAEWSDADPGVTLAADPADYTDRGRVLEHGPSGMYVGLFHTENPYNVSNGGGDTSGIRVVHSSDWNTTDNRPAGKTDTRTSDPWSGSVSSWAGDSFDNFNTDGQYDGQQASGLWVFEDQNNNDNGIAYNSTEVNYVASVTSDCLNLAAWHTDDTTYGRAAYHTFEYITNKFWADGNQPWSSFSLSNADQEHGGNCLTTGEGSWRYYEGQSQNAGGDDVYKPYTNTTGFDAGEWGFINPDSDDDTFFFRRPVMYGAADTPIAYIKYAVANRTDSGGSHGDTIEYNGETYRVFKQSGGGTNNIISAALRHE